MVIFHSYVSLPEGKGILQIFSCKKERGRSTSHGHLSINPFPRFIDDKFAIDFLHCKGPQKRIDPTDPTPKRLVMCLTWGTYEGRMCVFFHPPFRKTNSQVRWSGMLRVGVFCCHVWRFPMVTIPLPGFSILQRYQWSARGLLVVDAAATRLQWLMVLWRFPKMGLPQTHGCQY